MSPSPRSAARVAALLLAASAVLVPATAADAASSAKQFASCAAVHRVYSGGIAKAGVKTNTVRHANGSVSHRALQGHVKFSTALYRANSRLDRDSDGIACEKS